MKKHLTILFIILVITKLSAQEYLILDFTSNNNLDSLYVENITKGTNLMLNGSDTLHLVIESTTLIESNFKEPSINIYPNPSHDVSYIQYTSTKPGEVTFEICDISGHTISKRNLYLEQNQHLFSISGLSSGIYLVNVAAESIVLTERFIITNNAKEECFLYYRGISEMSAPCTNKMTQGTSCKERVQNRNTKNIIEMDFEIGDQLLIIGYAIGYEDITIYLSPTEDQSLELELEECIPPTCPEAGIHSNSQTQIIWNWSTSENADGYKYSSTNNYESASNNGTNISFTQSGLNCSTEHTLFVWAYNDCGESEVLVLNEETEICPWVCGDSFIDPRDGNSYQTVQIGYQCWMAENLKYLPSVYPPSENSQFSEYYYVYDYFGTDIEEAKSTENYSNYGVLYNFTAAITACPSGWQVPSDGKWKTLEMYVGMSQEAADNTGLRGTNQGSKLAGVTDLWSYGTLTIDSEFDSCGFSAVPGGCKYVGPDFLEESTHAMYWGIPGIGSNFSIRDIHSTETKIQREINFLETVGLSIRCLKN